MHRVLEAAHMATLHSYAAIAFSSCDRRDVEASRPAVAFDEETGHWPPVFTFGVSTDADILG